MNQQAGPSGALLASLRAAVQRAASGTKRDAAAAGRLLEKIPAGLGDPMTGDVEAVLAGADPRFWVALETARDSLYWGGAGWSASSPEMADSVPALMVKALAADGRVRERAVRLLGEAKSRAAMPVLGLRAADWVPNVRDVARQTIGQWLEDDADGSALAAVAPMAFLLGERREGRWLVGEVNRKLVATAGGPVVARLLTSSDRQLRRAAYGLLLENGDLTLERAVSAAVRDADVVIRNRCAAYASRLAGETGALSSAREMLASRTPLVRAEAMQALNRLDDHGTISSMLFDRSSLVRGTARFYLKSHGVDFAQVYRLRLEEGGDAVTPGTVAGMAEVGTAADAELMRSLLSHPRAKVRVEALRGLAAFAAAIDGDEILTLAEHDPSPAVVKQAATLIADRGVVIETDRLLAMLDPARPVRVRLAARRMLAERDSAWRLAVNVMLLADREATVARRAREDLEAALRRQVHVQPSGQTADLLAAHLPEADRLLSPTQARLLRFVARMRLSGR